jgi:hypothetical protein
VIERRAAAARRIVLVLGVKVGHLPELDQRAECRARRDKRGCGTGRIFLFIDDAHASGAQLRDDWIEMIHLDRQMMHPLAVLVDKFADEAGLARQILNQLDDETAEMEILPVESAADLIVASLGTAFERGKIAGEEFRRAID